MVTKEFNNLEEIKKYYDEATNTYVFKNNDEYIDLVVFNFDLDVEANIHAYDINANRINAYNIYACDIKASNIYACDIKASNIYACDIYAGDINACDIKASNIYACDIYADDISYYAVCFAYKSIKCKSIKGRIKNAKHFVLDGEIIFIKDEELEEND